MKLIFVVKRKTAYEMRISDWSSDVCSSDLVSFRVPAGKTVALVGESGSGKSVVSQAIMGILPRTARIDAGRILFHDPVLAADRAETMIDIAGLAPDSPQMRAIRGARISIVFQEPMTSLSPVHTVGNQISEALHLHRKVSRAEGERSEEHTSELQSLM